MSTSHDIARLAGVSRGTVDRVLNNRPNVKPDTRERVLEALKELGYRPNYIASSLSRKRTNSIGIVVFDLDNRFIAQMVGAAENRLRQLGYFSYLTLTHKDKDEEINCVRHLLDRRVDGIIIMPVGKNDTMNELSGVPAVTVGNRLGALPYVGIDELSAGAMAAKHIKSKGYISAVYVAPPLAGKSINNVWAQEQRYEGFLSEMDAELITEHDFEVLLPGLIKTKRAFFFSTDKYAMRAMKYFKNIGIKPGEDVGIMGFDCIDLLDYFKPKLDTVSFPIESVGKSAAEGLVSIIDSKDFKDTLFNAEIVTGQTL